MNLPDLNWQFFISTITSFLSKIAPKTKKRWCVYTVIVVIICFSCLFIQDKTANQIVTEPPTSTLTSTTTPTSSTAASTTTTTTTAPTNTTPTTAVTDANEASAGTDPYLAELKVLQDASGVYYNKTYEVSGQPYVHSILAECGSSCTTQKKISYNLGKKYRKLTFGVGIEDNSATREQVAVFTLIADGKPIFEKTTQKNEPVTSQEVDVTDVLTLELAVTATKNKSSQLVWMTPQLHS